ESMDAPVASAVTSDQLSCPRCETAYLAGDRFCRNCGLELHGDVPAIEAYLAKVVPERLDSAMAARFKEQRVVEVEIAEKLAERAVGWLKTFGFLIGIPVLIFGAILSFVGIKAYSDFEKVLQKAESFETSVSDAEKGVQKRVGALDGTLKQ